MILSCTPYFDCLSAVAVLQQLHTCPCRTCCPTGTNAALSTQEYLKQMEVVRKRVLEQPGILPELVRQLQSGDIELKIKAAEMLFCVVGQGPGRDVDATREVSSDHTADITNVNIASYLCSPYSCGIFKVLSTCLIANGGFQHHPALNICGFGFSYLCSMALL